MLGFFDRKIPGNHDGVEGPFRAPFSNVQYSKTKWTTLDCVGKYES